MSAEPTAEEATEERAEGETEQPSRIAGGFVLLVLTGVAVLVMKVVVTAAPYVAYFVAGVLVTVAWQKGRARWGRRGDDGEQTEGVPTPDVGEALRRLIGDDRGVLLTRLRDELQLPDTKVVKRLLDADGIKWKPVRTRHGNGPGVHASAIPPAPSPAADSHGDGCCCRSGDNSNGNNGQQEGDEKGIRVDRTDTGFTIHDLLNSFFAEASKNRPRDRSTGEVSDR